MEHEHRVGGGCCWWMSVPFQSSKWVVRCPHPNGVGRAHAKADPLVMTSGTFLTRRHLVDEGNVNINTNDEHTFRDSGPTQYE